MTKNEWTVIATTAFAGWWSKPLEPEQRDAWFGELERFDRDQVLGALRSLLRSSPRFAPRLGEVISALEPTPAFDVLWSGIAPVLRHGSVLDPDVAVARIAETVGPLAAGWVASYGVRRLAMEPVLDPEFGGAVLKRLRDSYTQLVTDDAGRQLALVRAQRAVASLKTRAEALAALPETTGAGLPD